jgi:hypothetical protein
LRRLAFPIVLCPVASTVLIRSAATFKPPGSVALPVRLHTYASKMIMGAGAVGQLSEAEALLDRLHAELRGAC